MGNPYATIVILTMGDAHKVVECLRKQTFQDFEIIFAREKGIVNAMNSALYRAKGEIFIRLDDDVEIPELWLAILVGTFKDRSDLAGVTGPTFVPEERRKNRDSIILAEKPNWFLNWLYDGCLCCGKMDFKPAGIRKCGCVSYDSNYIERFTYPNRFPDIFECDHLEGTNWAMRTKLLWKIGGFDPKFDGVAEWFDTDAEQKIKKLGYKLVYNPEAKLHHLLDFTEHYNDRFDGLGRIKNWIRFHHRHSKFHWKMIVFLIVWLAYFAQVRIKKCFVR